MRGTTAGTTSRDIAAAQAVESFLADHYSEKLHIHDLASHVNVSVRTLQNICHLHFNEPPLKVLRRFRLSKLYERIQMKPWTSMRALLDQCGLSGGQVDHALFVEMYGVSIKALQQACRNQTASALLAKAAKRCASMDQALPRSA